MPRLLPLVALALASLAGPAAWAGSPSETLRDLFAAANRIVLDPATAERPMERLRELRKLVNDAFDFRGAAELALGSEWQARTPAEQQEFVRLFADLLERAYLYRVAAQASVSGGVRVSYLGESVERDLATVETAVERKDGGEVRLDYRMAQRGERWLVRDVAVEGVSIVANYRAQFQRVIQGASYPKLVSQMRAKTGDLPTASRVVMVEPASRSPEVEAAPAAGAERVGPVADQPATRTPPPAITRATARAFWVQVGAFKNPDLARRLANRLRQENVTLAEGGGGTASLVRVRVGPFADRRQALATLRQLRAKGYKPFILESQG
jgi:phospholipid transport system substrate-binding protein